MIIPHQDVFGDAKIIQWDVNLSQTWQADSRGENANDLARNAIDEDMFSERIISRTEAPAPSAVSNQRHLSTVRNIVCIIEIATELRRNAENGEEICTNASATNAFGRCSISARKIVGIATVE